MRERYIKLPIEVEAVKWTGDNLREVIDFAGLHESANKWTWEEYNQVVKNEGLKIFTLEGPMMASIGDFIIRGINGEYYPCKPDIFERSYSKSQPKPAVQSAEELVCQIVCGVATAGGCGNTALCDAAKHSGERLIERDAAQRQAGREEEREQYKKSVDVDEAYMRTLEKQIDRYAALEEAARFLVSGYLGPCRYGDIENDIYDLRKVLRELDEARKGRS